MQSREYNISEVITFKKTNEPFGGLSNMAGGYSLNVNGIIIPSSEHLYQACRYPLFPKIQEEIIAQHSPMTAKMISKKYHDYTRQDWNAVRIKVMRWALQVKLSQNWEKFGSLLLQTGDKAIVELSHKDKIWAAVQEGDKLVGVNALGRLLMDTRDKFARKDTCQKCVEPPPIAGFLLFNNDIELVCNESFEEELLYSSDKIEIV